MHLLSAPFRIFFPLLGLYGPLFLMYWVGAWFGWLRLPGHLSNPIAWHAHEMLWGWVGTGIGGFLFTAVANWTGRPPIRGAVLGSLVLFWLTGRFVMLVDVGLDPLAIMVIDSAYLFLAAVLFGRELYYGRNLRNTVVLVILLLFLGFNVVYHLESAGILADRQAGIRGGTLVAILLIALIGGRIIPAFTRNWLVRHRPGSALPAEFGRPDQLAIASILVLLPCFVLWPGSVVTGCVAAISGGLHLFRISRWRGLATGKEPLLLVMHVGYLWMPVGLLLLGGQILMVQPYSAAIHALTAGCLTTMIVAVSSRATLGHSGAPLEAGPLFTSAYLLVTLAALLRVISSLAQVPWMLGGTVAILSLAMVAYLWRLLPLVLRES